MEGKGRTVRFFFLYYNFYFIFVPCSVGIDLGNLLR
jgi:hypothetical protein